MHVVPLAQAQAFLRAAAARGCAIDHKVLTGLSVISPDGRRGARLVESKVRFKRLTPADFEAYLACGEGIGKAGGYGIQGLAALFVEHIDGSHSGIMGLPLYETARLLRQAGLPLA